MKNVKLKEERSCNLKKLKLPDLKKTVIADLHWPYPYIKTNI